MKNITYKITNPYEEINNLIPQNEQHYKTNLHTHTTYSDANNTLADMVFAFYDQDFDIVAFTDHGILGKPWDQKPTTIPLYLFQLLWHGKRKHLTTEEFRKIQNGTYKSKANKRTKSRGILCVTNAIEANMLTLVKNHVNGYFTDDACEGVCGKENDYRIPIQKIDKSGGISHINHPSDWLQARTHPEHLTDPERIRYFADILRDYPSCLGTEALNMDDNQNRGDRIVWDELLKLLIPEERQVWGFGNSDAHAIAHIDSTFMDFILPECSIFSLRHAMETGHFFSISRYAKNELGPNFKGEGPYPMVTNIAVDDDEDTITISGINCNKIQWVADGKVIQTDLYDENEIKTSTIKLTEYRDKISCYVRAQLLGKGGICLTQAFICDDGNMQRFIKPTPPIKELSKQEKMKEKFFNTRLGVIIDRLFINK